MSDALRVATPRREFWKTTAGKEVQKRFEIWALRIASGGAVHVQDGSHGGGRGKPGDIPEAMCLALDIDNCLKEWEAPIGALIEWHYGPRRASLHTFEDEATDALLQMFYPSEMGENFQTFDLAKIRLLKDCLTRFGEFVARRLRLGEFK